MTAEEAKQAEGSTVIVRPNYSLLTVNEVSITEGNYTVSGAGTYEALDDERALATVTASAKDKSGKTFRYWLDAGTNEIASYSRSYSFFVVKDTELTPVYGDSAETAQPVIRITDVKYVSDGSTVNFYAERSVPEGYTVVQTGIVVTKNAVIGNNTDMFMADAEGTAKGVSTQTTPTGTYSAGIKTTSGSTAYGRAYLICEAPDGSLMTLYSAPNSYTVK
jgi:hypothetical protein